MSQRGEVPHQKSHNRRKPSFQRQVLRHDARSQLLAQPLPGFQYHPEWRANGHLSVGPLASHWLFLIPQAWGRHTNMKNLVLSRPDRKNMPRKQIPGFCFPCSRPKSRRPAHRTALRPALRHSSQYSRAVGCCPTPPQGPTPHPSQVCLLCLA